MTGAGAVVALVLLEWTIGALAAAAWTQSWSVVRRGHFRIVAWSALVLGAMAVIANRAATSSLDVSLQPRLVAALAVAAVLYVLMQYVRTDVPGAVAGGVAAVVGVAALVSTGELIDGWSQAIAALGLIAGALLLGSVTNGMLLGHWYLNQPGLKPWALARLTDLTLAGVALSAVAGIVAVGRLATASTEGAVLGIPGFGDSFGAFFYATWLVLLAFTGGVAWAARRCVKIRSIQSATGLFYVAILTAAVSEFVVRYLMLNAP